MYESHTYTPRHTNKKTKLMCTFFPRREGALALFIIDIYRKKEYSGHVYDFPSVPKHLSLRTVNENITSQGTVPGASSTLSTE